MLINKQSFNQLFLPTLCMPALLTLCLMVVAGNASAVKADRQQPVELTADQSEFDAVTGFTLITGNVEIYQGTLEIHSDEARVFMQNGRMSRILLDGNPATWKQQLESGEWMDAKSAQIDYDVNAEQILLIGNAVVDHPQGEITGDRISYDLSEEKLRGDSTSGGRIRMRIEPDVVENNTVQPPVSDANDDQNDGQNDGQSVDANANSTAF